MIDLAIAVALAWAGATAWSVIDDRLQRKRAEHQHRLHMEHLKAADEGSAAAHARMRDIIRLQAEASLRFAEAMRPDEDEPWKRA